MQVLFTVHPNMVMRQDLRNVDILKSHRRIQDPELIRDQFYFSHRLLLRYSTVLMQKKDLKGQSVKESFKQLRPWQLEILTLFTKHLGKIGHCNILKPLYSETSKSLVRGGALDKVQTGDDSRLHGRGLLEILGLGKAFYDPLFYQTFRGTYLISRHI